MKYKAFISYRHTENGRRHAVALETALKRYAKPTLSRPMKIFRDEKHFKPDISLPKLIRDGLENSEYLIFLAEKASAESPWCGQELEQWCNPEQLNRTPNLIIALIDDDFVTNETHDGIHWEKTTALPALLRPYLTSIPLYVDLRWAKNPTDTDLQHTKYRHEINALTARLKGVNPEDLNDEEIRVHRQNIRLRNGAIGVLLAMLLVSVGFAWEANKQRKNAENAVFRSAIMMAQLKTDTQLYDTTDISRIHYDRITFLSFRSFGLSKLPKQVFELKNLTTLDLRENQLSSLIPDIVDLKNLTALDLSDSQLSSLPIEIGELKNLKELVMDFTRLSSLPAEIGKLKNLTELDLSYNGLSRLPTEIGGLRNLTLLDLHYNQLKRLPSEVGELKNLTNLKLSTNQLSRLPAEIGKLENLTELDLNGNQLRRLPSEIGELKNLTELYLDGNQLSKLPDEIGKLKKLTRLHLNGNLISVTEQRKIRQLLPGCKIYF